MKIKYGSILKACRERAGMSQEDMADELHRDQACISRFEKDMKKIEFAEGIRWLQITQAPEVAIAFFLGVDGATMMQQIIDMISSLSAVGMIFITFFGSILLGGFIL